MRTILLSAAALALAGHAAAADIAVIQLSAPSLPVNELSSGGTATVSITDNDGAPATLDHDLQVTIGGGLSPVTVTLPAGTSSASVTIPVSRTLQVGAQVALTGSFSDDVGTGSIAASLAITQPVTGNG